MDPLFLITALRKHAVSTFHPFGGCPHFVLNDENGENVTHQVQQP